MAASSKVTKQQNIILFFSLNSRFSEIRSHIVTLQLSMIIPTFVIVIFFTMKFGKERDDLSLMTNELNEHGTKGFVVVSGQYSSHFF